MNAIWTSSLLNTSTSVFISGSDWIFRILRHFYAGDVYITVRFISRQDLCEKCLNIGIAESKVGGNNIPTTDYRAIVNMEDIPEFSQSLFHFLPDVA